MVVMEMAMEMAMLIKHKNKTSNFFLKFLLDLKEETPCSTTIDFFSNMPSSRQQQWWNKKIPH